MKRYLVIAGLLLIFSSVATAAWAWEDSDKVDNSGLFDQIKNSNSANDYCPDASTDNQERYCVDVEGWDSVSLQGNDGLDNILSIYTDISQNGALENSEIDALLTIYTCYNEESADTIGGCVSQEFDFSAFDQVNPSELRSAGNSNSGDNNDGSDSDNDESSDDPDNQDSHEHTLGDLYFWDTEAERALVNTEAGSGYDGQRVEYDMYDGRIEGAFRWDNNDRVQHTLWIRNEHTQDTETMKSSAIYVDIPTEGGDTWGTDESGIHKMSSSGCTKFTVAVLPPNWDGEDQEVSSDAEQMNQFTFCPNNRQDESQQSSSTKSSESYSFTLSPKPQDITTGTDVSLKVEGSNLDGKQVRLELNNVPGFNNDPWTSVTCSGSPCSVKVDSDRLEGEPGTINARVRVERTGRTRYWTTDEQVSWNLN